jgi:hypothetical protein
VVDSLALNRILVDLPLGRGGIVAVARATNLAISTVTLGRNEVRAGVTPSADLARSRRRSATAVGVVAETHYFDSTRPIVLEGPMSAACASLQARSPG